MIRSWRSGHRLAALVASPRASRNDLYVQLGSSVGLTYASLQIYLKTHDLHVVFPGVTIACIKYYLDHVVDVFTLPGRTKKRQPNKQVIVLVRRHASGQQLPTDHILGIASRLRRVSTSPTTAPDNSRPLFSSRLSLYRQIGNGHFSYLPHKSAERCVLHAR